MPKLDLTKLDVVTVQSAGLRKLSDGTYAPTQYSDRDDFGMLGGHVRVWAAQELYWQNPTLPFVFCNGKSAKQIAKFGPDVPTDAEIYAMAFREGLAHDPRSHIPGADPLNPNILLENTSVNTAASISNLIGMCTTNKWKHMGLISSDYHIPRIQALCGPIFEGTSNPPITVTFISAEATLRELHPDTYDAEIDAAYKTPAALERIRNEKKGCEDIAAGTYHIGEFQLAQNNLS